MMASRVPDDSSTALTAILTSTLEARGVLGKIRAELRASVFTAIHDHQMAKGLGSAATAHASLHQDGAGRLATQLVLELLQTCQLDYSLSVLGPEANIKSQPTDRAAIASALNLEAGASSEPLLIQLVRAALPGGGGLSAPPAPADAAAVPSRPATSGSVATAPVAAKPSGVPASVEPSSVSTAPLAAQPVGKGPPSPPSPASPLLSVLPPLSKPKGPGGGGFLADLPPLSSRGATVPPLAGMAAMPPGAPGSTGAPVVVGGAGCAASGACAPSATEQEERRLDALENKLSTMAGLPLRAAASGNTPQLAPLGGGRMPAFGERPVTSRGQVGGVGGGVGGGACVGGGVAVGGGASEGGAYDEEEIVEEDVMEEDFEEDEGDESLSLDAGGATPPLVMGQSPSQPMPGRARQRLSPLESSQQSLSAQSLDESMSPSTLSNLRGGFDFTESIEVPRS